MPAAAAIPWLGTAIAGLAGAGAGIAGAEIGSSGQQAAADTTSQTAQQVAQIQKQAADEALAFQEQQAQQQQANFIAAQNANYNQWLYQQGIVRPYQAMGTGAMDMLGGLLGVTPAQLPPTPAAPTFTTYGMPGQAGPAPSGTPTGGGANYQPLVQALNSGQSPQAAIDAANKAQGLPTGASYAWRSIPNAPGGGVVEIPGGSYLTPNPQGQWGWVAGDSANAAPVAPPSTLMTMFNPYTVPQMSVPFQPLNG